MMQQSSRLLLKQAELLKKGKRCAGYMAYLNNTEEFIRGKSDAKSISEFLRIEHLERALATRACYQLKELHAAMSSSNATELEQTNDLFAVEIRLATRLHLEYVIVQLVSRYVKAHSFTDSRIRPILDILL